MPIQIQFAPAKILSNFVLSDLELERSLTSRTNAESRQRESLDETLRRVIRRKPSGPYLKRHTLRISRAASAA